MTSTMSEEKVRASRAAEFDRAAAAVSHFKASLGDLLSPIDDDEELNVLDLEHALATLSDIFDSKAARESWVLGPLTPQTQEWINSSFFQNVLAQLKTVREYLEGLTRVSFASIPISELRTLVKGAVRRSKLHDFAYLPEQSRQDLQVLLGRLWNEIRDYERDKKLRDLEGRTQAAVTRTEAAADVAAKAAGKTSDDVMSSFYANLAKAEADNADKFRRFTVGFALGGGGLALIFVLLPTGVFPQLDAGANDWARLIQKTVLIAGIFGIAGYFARQAHQHRSMANWAQSLSVQLQTFDAYVLAVDNAEIKDELRKNFAARVFGDHPAMKGEPTVTPSAAAMDTAVGWAAKLTGGAK